MTHDLETKPITIEEVRGPSPELVDAVAELAREITTREAIRPTVTELEQVIAAPGTTLLLARTGDGSVVGMLTLAVYDLLSGKRAIIEDVAVLPFAGGRGTGTALVTAAKARAKAAGATECELLVDPGQSKAIKLFEREGFRRMSAALAYQARL